MGRRRETRYPARVSVYMTEERRDALKAAAERYGIAPGLLARWAFEAGYPKVRDRLRARQRKEEGKGAERDRRDRDGG